MTTAFVATQVRPASPAVPYVAPAVLDDGYGDMAAGCLLLSLVEFGQSLDNPGLDWWFEGFAQRNKAEADYEITALGELKIMPPTGMPEERYEVELVIDVGIWGRNYGGQYGGPTARFIMPDGSRLGPDAWYISAERWEALPAEARRPPFAAIVPDLVAEIVSRSNRGPELLDKVRRYLEGGALLVWVINGRQRRVTIYRPGMAPEVLDDPEMLYGGDVMPGFAFDVRRRIFDYRP